MNPILLNRHVQQSLRELVHSTLNTSSKAFEGIVDRFLDNPENFIKGPWISVDMPFRQIDGAADGTWDQPFPEVPLKFPPYQHQIDAFARLSGDQMRSTLVATGTGSGKTESYLWPILEHCRQNKDAPGIKAILIYPMNALASDQARRIAAAINDLTGLNGVKAGIYADAEPKNPTMDVTPDSVITHRDTMRKNPPDVLLTNYKMLDYLLLRGRDKPLWDQNAPETLKFLVVDEMHTFDGAQGADLALLIRRLKHRLNTPDGHLTCVGSSATLGTGDGAKKELREYAETIFGEAFDADAVVTETRQSSSEVFDHPEYTDRPYPDAIRAALGAAEDMGQADAAKHLALCLFPDASDPDLKALQNGEPTSPEWRVLLGSLLKEQQLAQRTLMIIAEHSGPASLEDVAKGLSSVKALRGWSESDHRALAELIVALVAWARSEGGRPLFNVRLQVWIREMARMVANLPRLQAGLKKSSIDLIHAIDLDTQALRGTLPLVNCNRCGTSAHLGRQNANSASCWAPLEQLYEEFFSYSDGGRLRLFYHEDLDRNLSATSSGNRIVPGMLDSESMEFSPSNHDDLEVGPASPVWMYDPSDDSGKMDATCPACGQSRGLLLFGMRAARLTTGITGTMYSSEQNEEDADDKPRFLIFSDSVQDAAHRASVAETRNTLSVYQKSLFEALSNTADGKLSLEDVIQTVPKEHLADLGGDTFTARFIPKEQTWRHPYVDLTEHGVSITDPVFLDHMAIRLGWEFFVDLSYRSHFNHTLELNGAAAADVPAEHLRDSADKLARQLKNAFGGAPDVPSKEVMRFLMGLLQRMRRQGSVAHPYVELAAEASSGSFGMNWFAASSQLGLGRTGTLPRPNAARGAAPIPVTLGKSLSGVEKVTRKHITNWYRDWLFRCLSEADLRISTEPEEVYKLAFERLRSDGLIKKIDGSDGSRHVWLIDPKNITVSLKGTPLCCDTCGRRELSLVENQDLLVGSSCPKIGCQGHLHEAEPAYRPALKRSLRSDRNHRVVAREHTGLLNAEQRHLVETGYINEETAWAPNLISATPTLEMGIDIGDLSTLLLGSVPPEEANYVQRMGRSGRRDGNALNLVLANARPHDIQFWEDPTPMLAGQVSPPGVFLAAEEVLLRQVTAFTLDAYVLTVGSSDDYGKVRDVLKARKSGVTTGFPIDWLEMVKANGEELAKQFIARLPEDVQLRADLCDRIKQFLTGTDDLSLPWRIMSVFDGAEEDRARLVEKREEATKELASLKKREAELTKEEFEQRKNDIERDRKEINAMIRQGIDDVQVIKYLTDKGVLPNYAFPEEGVKLTSILFRQDTKPGQPNEPNQFEYSRPASSALSEFAPGQYFYANGRQVQIERIEIGKEDLSVWTFCQSCSYVAPRHEAGSTSGNCPKCGDNMWIDSGSDHTVVKLKSVIAASSEEKASIRDGDQRDQQLFDRELTPFHAEADVLSSWFTDKDAGAPFGFEFIPDCTFRDFNYGSKSSAPIGPTIAGSKRESLPFRICKHCGTIQKPPRDEDDRGVHPPSCKVSRDGIGRSDWETEVFLMRSFDTEAMRIIIPVAGDADHNDLKSFVAAINLGMRRHFAGKVDHIRSTVYEARLDSQVSVRSLYLYDAVPGGSGYLRQIAEHPDTMKSIVSNAIEALRDCDCNHAVPEKDGCFRCVKPYRSQFGPGEPSRDRARALMEATLGKWDSLTQTAQNIDAAIMGALVESKLEARFLNALMRIYGDAALKPQVLDGGHRGYVLRAGTADQPKLWTVEPQVQLETRFKGVPKKRVDFLMTSVTDAARLPVVIEMDGYEYHADTVHQDLLDRIGMVRSGEVRVWTLGWKDLDETVDLPVNPFAESTYSARQVGTLGKVLAVPGFAQYAKPIKSLQSNSSLEGLVSTLNGQEEPDPGAFSVALRCFVKSENRLFGDLPSIANLSDESRVFLQDVSAASHLGHRQLDLFVSCDDRPPPQWGVEFDDLRCVLKVDLPDKSSSTTSKHALENVWRGLWRAVNFLQSVPGLHIDVAGLDTLLPPSLTDGAEVTVATDIAWLEARTLCDEVFHPLIDGLVAAGVSPPDALGDDLKVSGRVVGALQFGWSSKMYGVSEVAYKGTGWDLLVFDPEGGNVSDAISNIIRKLEEAGK